MGVLMNKTRFIALVVSGSIIATGSVLGVSTAAQANTDLMNGAALLTALAPSKVWSDSPDTAVQVAQTKATTSGVNRLRVERPASPTVTVSTHPDGSPTQSLQFSLDATTELTSSSNGVTTFATDSSSVGRYVSEAPTGASILTAYAAPQESYESRTTFNFRQGEHPVAKPDGGFYLKSDGIVRGVLEPAWAIDAAGNNLDTSYRWDGSTLVQTVDVPTNAKFPVLADPAWDYTWTAIIKVGSTADIHKRMHSCFNCIFPVNGAPKAFPKPGQALPLNVPIVPGVPGVSFACKFRTEQYIASGNPLYPAGDFGFVFDSAKGHVDGLGSWISFDWVGTPSDVARQPGEKMQFIVYGSIANPNPGGVPRAVYLTGAKATWSQFATRYVLANGGSAEQSWYWTN